MNKDDSKLNINKIKTQLKYFFGRVSKYKVILFIVFVVLVYGFVWVKIASYNNAEPSSQQVDSEVQAASIPHIDPAVLKQIKSLQDNSVSVQALFNKARNNPFSSNPPN